MGCRILIELNQQISSVWVSFFGLSLICWYFACYYDHYCWVLDRQLWESSSLKRCRQPWKPKIQKRFHCDTVIVEEVFNRVFRMPSTNIASILGWDDCKRGSGYFLAQSSQIFQLVFSFFRFSVDSNPNGGTLRNIYRCSLRLASTHHQYLRVKQAKYRCAVYTCVCCVLDATIKIDTMWQVNFDQLHP